MGNSIAYFAPGGNGALKVTLVTIDSASPASPSKVGFTLPDDDLSTMPLAIFRATGALNCSAMSRIGRHAACAFSRSQVKSAENGSRTLKVKRFSSELSTPLGDATPLPYTSCTLEPDVMRRAQDTVRMLFGSLLAFLSKPSDCSTSVRRLSMTVLTPRREPTSLATHQMFASTLNGSAGPLSSSTKTCSSSMAS